MPRIHLNDVAYVAYEVPDLELLEQFLTDFGMTRAALEHDALYMRGAGPRPYIHVSKRGETSRFLGAAFEVESRRDLELASEIAGASQIVPIEEPGGGERVTLLTPNGHTIWLEFGATAVRPSATRKPYPLNVSTEHARFNRAVRQKIENVPVLRIGHFVLWVKDAAAEVAWMREHFNLTPSDYICVPGDPEPIEIGTFLRYARGGEFVEHHCLLITQSSSFGCHHSSFEVLDLDAVQAGHEYLAQMGWTLDAGVGRHLLGSLIYDYWLDPFGHRIEHYTDTDLVNDDHEPTRFVGSADQTTQWGMAPPPSFFD